MTDAHTDVSDVRIIDNIEEIHSAALELIKNTRKRLTLFTPDLEPDIYNHDSIRVAMLDLLKRSRHTEIRILVEKTKKAIELEHCLLRLVHYADHQFQLKTLESEAEHMPASFLIGDTDYLIRRQNSDSLRTLCYTGDRARTKTQLEDFDQVWRFAIPDPSLRRLTI